MWNAATQYLEGIHHTKNPVRKSGCQINDFSFLPLEAEKMANETKEAEERELMKIRVNVNEKETTKWRKKQNQKLVAINKNL